LYTIQDYYWPRSSYLNYFEEPNIPLLKEELHVKENIVLEENMCITLEPGIYVDGLGGVRIEDDVLVTKNGLQRFTKSSKDLIIL